MENNKIRAFISIDMPKEIQKKIEEIQDSLPGFYGKKTEPNNLHLTIKFLSHIDEKKVEVVKEKLKEIKFSKFETIIDELGFFSEKFIRIIWLHLSNTSKLQKQIDDKLKDLFEREARFMSHLTIARVKKVRNKKRFLEDLKKIKFEKIKFLVNNFKLKSSTLTEKGPIYEDIEIYNLI